MIVIQNTTLQIIKRLRNTNKHTNGASTTYERHKEEKKHKQRKYYATRKLATGVI